MPLPSLFASYKQIENQLTNALAQTLGHDADLAAEFAARFTSQRLKPAEVAVSTQARPREMARWYPNLVETPDDTKPDAWVIDAESAIAIESKLVPGALGVVQLKGHCRVLPPGGTLLVLTPDPTEPPVVEVVRQLFIGSREVRWSNWQDVYVWAARAATKRKAASVSLLLLKGFRAYLETLDMIGFAGIDLADGWDYARAKSLVRALAKDVTALAARDYPGLVITRSQIREEQTEDGAQIVWLALGTRAKFTAGPHFSLAIIEGTTRVALTVPNGSRASWPRLRLAVDDGSLDERLTALKSKLHGRPIAAASVDLYQRSWSKGRRAPPDWLGTLSYSIASPQTNPMLKEAVLGALRSGLRKGNWEMQTRIDYANSNAIVGSVKFANEVADVLVLLKPLYVAVGG